MKNRKLFTFIVLSVLGVSTALACGWSFWTDHSVRFNSMRTGRGFYRLPPLPLRYDHENRKELTALQIMDDDYWSEERYTEDESDTSDENTHWTEALEALKRGDVQSLESALRQYLHETRYGNQLDNRNSAVDVLDVVNELNRGASKASVLEYARMRLEGSGGENTSGLLSDDEEVRRLAVRTLRNADRAQLEDNWEYLRSARLFNSDQKDLALTAFRDHSARFPKSEKNEAVMYMVGRITLEKSHATKTENCGIEGVSSWGKEVDPAKIEPAEKCRDEHWQAALNQFREIARKFPNGRYRNDVRGWIAFLHKRGGERAESLAEYYRLLGQTGDPRWRLEAKKSLQIIGHDYADATLDKVEELLRDEPEAALAYAYHRIYNHAVETSYVEFDEWRIYGEDKWSQERDERERVKEAVDVGKHELERVARFSSSMISKYGMSRVSGDFLLRVAQAQIELENFREAKEFADKAIARGVEGDSRAQALWVKGSVEHQQRQFSDARTTFGKLVKEFPDHTLIEGTRRLLAITAEDQDDLEFALDQYLAIGYNYDVAYFVDVLMPTERLAKYVERQQATIHRDYMNYALAIRYMRDGKWSESRETLLKIPTKIGIIDRDGFEKDPEYWRYHNDAVVKTEWLNRDLQTIDDMQRLEQSVKAAADDEAKAEALYQLASYQFDADPLLFYNPAAWRGMRHMLLSSFANAETMRRPGEQYQILESSRLHETYARAIPIYLDIVDRFPESKAAKDALYSAVVAHEKLGSLNPYWRDVYSSGFYASPRWVGNADIRRMFPKFRWPRSRLGWEASSRRVKGGPTYDPLPKPPPKLTTEQRVVRKVEKWVDKYGGTVWEKTLSLGTWIKNGAGSVSAGVAGYVQDYFYLIYTGLLGAIFWANRKEIYEGPVTKGSILLHRGLVIVGRYFRDWWVAIAVPSVIRVNSSAGSKEGTTPSSPP